MGRIYRPVELEYGYRKATTVAIIDTGADETVISERLAGKVNSDLYGVFKAICASDTILEGKYADVTIREQWSGVEIIMTVGVSDKPFGADDIDDEGFCAISGSISCKKQKCLLILVIDTLNDYLRPGFHSRLDYMTFCVCISFCHFYWSN